MEITTEGRAGEGGAWIETEEAGTCVQSAHTVVETIVGQAARTPLLLTTDTEEPTLSEAELGYTAMVMVLVQEQLAVGAPAKDRIEAQAN